MNTFAIAIAIFGLVQLAWAVTGTKETAGTRLLAIVISLIALTVAALAAIVFQEGRRIGYARVSTQDQDLSAQLAALKAAGADTIYREKISGVRADRPQLKKMVAALGRGDLVIVTRLDRLGRSVRELLNLLAEFDKIGVGFRSLADVWCDTTTAHGRLMLTVLGGLAEFERELIRQRTGEGRARALAAGVRFGRKPKLTDHQRKEAMARRGNGETLAQIARSYAVSVCMISRL